MSPSMSLSPTSSPTVWNAANQFDITLVDMGATPAPPIYKAAFEAAKARWEAIIVGELSDYEGIVDWFGGMYQICCAR
jgi:hypothetical protein